MEKEKKKPLTDKIWDIFTSVKLAIVIFVVLSLTSIIGTIIEQNAAPERNIKLLSKLFGQSAAPTFFRIFDSLGLMDMYHSWWFFAILLVFAANLIICSIERLPGIMRLVREPVKPMSEEGFERIGIKKEVILKGDPAKVKETVSGAIKKITGFNISEAGDGESYNLYSQKGRYTRLGVYVVHFSIIVILIGAIIGIFFGFKGSLNLPEGAASSVAYTGNDKEKPLGFSVRCDEFDVEFYGNTDMPKKYMSRLTVIKDGKEVMKKMIAVNEPLKYEGTTFYQSSYGIVPGGVENGVFRFKVTPKDGKTTDVNLKFGGTFTITGTGLTGRIEDFSPALAFNDKTNMPFTYAEQMSNPAVYLSFFEKGSRKYGGWVLKRYPGTWKLPEGHTVEFADLWGMQYTGLQVRNDPGVWVVYFGCIAMTIGLYIAFFTSHKKLWVRLTGAKNNTRVIIGAASNKNRQAMERQLEKLISFLTKTPEGGK